MLWVYLLEFFALSLFVPHTTAPRDRWIIRVDQPSVECFTDWVARQDRQLEITWRRLPVDGWMAIQLPSSQSPALQSLPCVLQVFPDRKIDWRDTEPNDPAYINQGDMELIGMPKAWDITTGGLTAQGDTIVVALIDDGFETNHPDLKANLWHNYGEIPDDSIDNDDNGYKDDYQGYNVANENDHHPVRTHGTSVAGVVGARGNNGAGVTGVNWKVKLMLISGGDFESQLIDAYQYVRDLREAYNTSGGAKGAFIVAANLSGGVNGALAQDHPLWCEMYDRIGEVGVLGVCAAPNNSISVDVDGDMPTTCTSPYMIAVTNVDLTDELVGNAGYGQLSIDIGAPGHGTITTATVSTYKEFLGTSAATPHVTGTIALMYATPCPYFLDGIGSHPDAIAAKVRDILFETGKPNNSLDGITTTGKRLEADAALGATNQHCAPDTEDEIRILRIGPNPANGEVVEVGFEVAGDTSTAFFDLYAANGAKLFHFPIDASQFASGTIRVPTETLPAGVYLLSLRNQKQKVTKKLFVY